jgi:hypothetical protein
MPDLTKETQRLIKNIDESLRLPPAKPGTTIAISHAVSKAAVLYEMARNAVEFRAEHLLRRAAIERILKRRFITNSSGEGVGELLVRELLWARYLDEDKVTQEKVDEVQATVFKYIDLKNHLIERENRNERNKLSDWLVGLASCEIEKKLAPAPIREALTNFVYRTLKEKVVIDDIKDKKTKDIQVYIAVHQAFAESDLPIIRFHLFLTYFPDWMETDRTGIATILSQFDSVYQEIENYLSYPQTNNLRRLLKLEMAPFLVIRDLVDEKPDQFKAIVSDSDKLEEAARKILKQRYQQTGAKLRRAATRSIIYIFLTKMLFALILEFPFDLLLGKTNFLALGINTLFPPFLMFLVTASIRLPGEENTKKIIAKIKEYCYSSAASKTLLELSQPTKRSRLASIFHFIYLLTSLIIFGLLFWLLIRLHFNPISMAIFLFFVCVVLFFGYRVRLITKDYVIQEKEGVLVPVVDFFSLPILRVGQILSAELAQINLLIFIFDFVIEAPFKAFFELVEEWFKFVRIKKEEITV